MKRRQFLRSAVLAGLSPLAARAASPTRIALVGGLLIDGYGGEPLEDSVVLIEDERIAAVGPIGSVAIPDDAERVSTEGMTVLPGLWDFAVRLSRLGHADRAHWDELYMPLAQRVVMPLAMTDLLRSGVTSARDIEGPLHASLAMRERVIEHGAPGPGLSVAGPAICAHAMSGAAAYRLDVDGPAEAKSRVVELVRAGVDLVTVTETHALSRATLEAIVATARAASVPVHALIATDADLAPALGAGVDGLVGIGDGTGPWPGEALAALGERVGDARPLVVASALSPVSNYAWLARDHEPLDDPRWREGWPPVVADDVRGSLEDTVALGAMYPDADARRQASATRIDTLLRAGALLVAGSDAGASAHLHHRATWQEVEALVRDAGLQPMEAIRRATYWPAVAAGKQHEAGTVSAGKYADVIAVRGDVLRHVDRLADVALVYRHGVRCG